MTYQPIISLAIEICKPHLKDVELDEIGNQVFHPGSEYNVVQPKYDGWWSATLINGIRANVFSSGGEHKGSFLVSIPKKSILDQDKQTVLIGEYLYGTTWANSNEYSGHIFFHDIFVLNGEQLYGKVPYHKRYKILYDISLPEINQCFHIMPSFHFSEWQNLWEDFVIRQGYEGLVFKSSLSADCVPYRCKRTFTKDYVFMGVNEGTGKYAGMTGSIIAGLYIDNVLTPVISVGGGLTDEQREEFWNSEEDYIGRVFECKGKAIYSKGTMRHPSFYRFRYDKKAEDCVP